MSSHEEEIHLQTIPQVIRDASIKWPNNNAVKFNDQTITYESLYDKTCCFIRGLQNIGIKKGDHVAVLMGGYPEWFYTSYALASLGAVIVPINVTFMKDEMLRVLRYSDATALIMMDQFQGIDYTDLLKEMLPEIAGSEPGYVNSETCLNLKTIISFSEKKVAYPEFYDFYDVLDSGANYSKQAVDELIDSIKPDDTSYMLFTSGSTGYPKPVLRSHGSNIGIAHYMNIGMDEDDVILGHLPFYHIAGSVYITLGAALNGSMIVLMEYFEPGAALSLIEEEKITQIGGFDTHFKYVSSHPKFKETDMSRIQKVILAAGPEWYTELEEMGFKDSFITHHYGFSEGTGVVMPLTQSDESIRKNSNGIPFPGVELKIIHPESGEDQPPNTPGEICLKGWTLFKGYYKMPKETAESFDQDGFFRTGDYGWVDENGYLYYRGRYKNMIKTGGENVSEREVEMFLEGHSDIKVVQVVGVPDSKWGEAVTAIVETRSGESLSVDTIRKFSKGRISGFKIPKHIVEIGDGNWPITPTGKYNKETLRAIAIEKLEIS